MNIFRNRRITLVFFASYIWLLAEPSKAEVIQWIDFSNYPVGQIQADNLVSTDGLVLDVSFTSSPNFRTGSPSSHAANIDDPVWPFANNAVSTLHLISRGSTTLTTTMQLSFANIGGFPEGGSIGVFDLELIGSSVSLKGYRDNMLVAVNWSVSFYQLSGVNVSQPQWDSGLNKLAGVLTLGQSPPTTNNFVFLTSDQQLDRIEMDIVAVPSDGIEFSVSARSVIASDPTTIINSHPYHTSYTGTGTPPWNRLDTSKTLAKEGTSPQLLTYNNLINTAQGINGVVFDIQNLPQTGSLNAGDFEFQVSPQGAFDTGANPPANWQSAPAPSSITVTTGSPDRILIQWPDQTIMNRWLRVTIKATANTGLSEPAVYYLGHLLGETTGPADNMFTVSFADITPIRADVGQTVDASSITDIDKNGTVSFADISAMRGNVGSQLTQISVP